MQKSKILALLLSLGLVFVPQISLAQTAEDLEQKAASAELAGNYPEAEKIWQGEIERDSNAECLRLRYSFIDKYACQLSSAPLPST